MRKSYAICKLPDRQFYWVVWDGTRLFDRVDEPVSNGTVRWSSVLNEIFKNPLATGHAPDRATAEQEARSAAGEEWLYKFGPGNARRHYELGLPDSSPMYAVCQLGKTRFYWVVWESREHYFRNEGAAPWRVGSRKIGKARHLRH